MRQPQGNQAIRTASIVVMVAALGVAVLLLSHRPASPPTTVAKRASATTSESVVTARSSDEPSIAVINLPTPTVQVPEADLDDAPSQPLAIPIVDARMAIDPNLLAAQQIALLRDAFIDVGSPGSIPVRAQSGTGRMSQQSGSAPMLSGLNGLELALLIGGDADQHLKMTTINPDLHRGWILIAGGQGGGKFALSRAELFNPQKLSFVAIGAMNSPRAHFAAADLADGDTLVAGGDDAQGKPLATAELYNPISGTFIPTGTMATARAGFTATVIAGCGCAADGKVLIAGGSSSVVTTPLATAELYDPTTGKFESTGSMNQARAWQTASLIASGPAAGDVLVAGGLGAKEAALASAELYDPRTETFAETRPMTVARAYQSATWLDPASVHGQFAGDVLVTGGWTGDTVTASAEVYNPADETFIPAGTMTAPRTYQSAVLMTNGQVLIAGGQGLTNGVLASAEIFDPSSDTFTATSPMQSVHMGAVAANLPNADVLLAGGRSDNAEVYNPSARRFTLIGSMPVDIAYAAGATLTK